MNKINRKLEYALISLKYMSEKNQGALTTVREVCQSFDCPFDATSRVLQQLAKAGILKSEQGARGGYLLVTDLRKVSLFHLIEIVIGPMEVARCMSDHANCELSPKCNIFGPVHQLNDQLINFYKGIKVGELLSAEAKTWAVSFEGQRATPELEPEVTVGGGL